MPVDPILKQDLQLVKQHFEEQALKQDGNAVYVPFSTMLRSQKTIHSSLKDAVSRYPAHYAQNTDSNESTLNRLQQECVPCLNRLNSLKELDIDLDIGSKLLNYDIKVINQLTSAFKNLNGRNPIEQHLCDIYKAYKSQCIPDLRRLLAAFVYLLTDIRSIDLKAINMNFITILASLLGKLMGTFTTNLDKFAQLITSTLKCVSSDLKRQLNKVDPILSKQNVSVTIDNINAAWNKKISDKQWVPDGLYQELSPKTIRIDNKITEQEQALTNSMNIGVSRVNQIIQGVIDAATKRIDRELVDAKQELTKLLKATEENMGSMNALLEQIQILQGLVSVLQGLIDSKGNYNPCGSTEDGRRFFSRVFLPGNKIIVQPGEDNPEDTEIIILKDPTIIDNPVVKDLLIKSGVIDPKTIISLDDSDKPTDTKMVNYSKVGKYQVVAEPMTISLFGCLGGEING